VRVDSGIATGLDVPMCYDPMLSKLVVWGEDRAAAIGRLRRALGEYHVDGIRTTLPFFRWLLDQPAFTAGRFHTTYLDEALQARNGQPFVEAPPDTQEIAAIAAAINSILTPPSPGAPSGAPQRWKAQARTDALRRLTEESRKGHACDRWLWDHNALARDHAKGSARRGTSKGPER
jgi:acetyl/propionyl-CoA carboxylase alpha subunit